MRRLRPRHLARAFAAATFAAAGSVAALAPSAQAEVDALLSALEVSACEFNRNGSWHSATEAKSHLLRKLKFLEDRGSVQTTEQFIDLAASTSSTTGVAYLVRCANAAPVPSRSWLQSRLQAMRSAGARPR